MPRYLLLPLTTVILVAMAIAMLASSVLLPMPDAAEVSVLGGTEVVRRFYAAVNETIATETPQRCSEWSLRRLLRRTRSPEWTRGEPGSRTISSPCMTPSPVCGWWRT